MLAIPPLNPIIKTNHIPPLPSSKFAIEEHYNSIIAKNQKKLNESATIKDFLPLFNPRQET